MEPEVQHLSRRELGRCTFHQLLQALAAGVARNIHLRRLLVALVRLGCLLIALVCLTCLLIALV